MDQAKKRGIAEAIDMVESFHAFMLAEIDKGPKNMMAIIHEHHRNLIRTLQ